MAVQIAQFRTQRNHLLRLAESAIPPATRIAVAALLVRLERVLERLQSLAGEEQPVALYDLEIALVHHIPDGDGLTLLDGRRVRYIGIDAPEIGGQNQPPEPWAEEAKALNQQLVLGKGVKLLPDISETDPHGRLLRYVFCDGQFVNAQLLLAGLARLCIIPPDTRYAGLLGRCQRAAQQARRGIWAKSSG